MKEFRYRLDFCDAWDNVLDSKVIYAFNMQEAKKLAQRYEAESMLNDLDYIDVIRL